MTPSIQNGLAAGREGAPSRQRVRRKSVGRKKVNEQSGSKKKEQKQKSDEEREQGNANGTENWMVMMTKRRMEKTKQGRKEEKRRIIVGGIRVATNEVGKGLMMLLLIVRHIENGKEE
jgi:hypothetical protein